MLRLVQLTDTHIYAEAGERFDGVDTRASFAAVLGALRDSGLRYDALLLSGDLAMDGSAAAYAWLADALADERRERFVLPGNHDVPGLLAQAELGSTCAPACVERGAWRLVLLDSSVPDRADGELGEEQRAWLARTLARPHAGHDLVCVHHHPMPVGSSWMDRMMLADAHAFWSVVEQHERVRCVVFGHVHQNVDRYRGPVRVLGSPSTCVQFAPRAARYSVDALAPAYRVIDLHDDGHVVTRLERVPLA